MRENFLMTNEKREASIRSTTLRVRFGLLAMDLEKKGKEIDPHHRIICLKSFLSRLFCHFFCHPRHSRGRSLLPSVATTRCCCCSSVTISSAVPPVFTPYNQPPFERRWRGSRLEYRGLSSVSGELPLLPGACEPEVAADRNSTPEILPARFDD